MTLPTTIASVNPGYAALAITASATNGAQVAAVLPAVANRTNYITGFDITGGGTTAAAVVAVTVTGLPTAVGTLTYYLNSLAGATGPMNTQNGLSVRFPDPIPASAVNAAITVTVPALSGNTMVSVAAYGIQA